MTEVLHSPPHFASSPTRTTTSSSSSPFSSFSCNAIFRAPSNQPHLPLLAFLVTLFRKSLLAFKSGCDTKDNLCNMDIGSPTNVRHVAHVTFDRFNGFLGLPVEFEPEVPRRPPSASATVFGVSTESMQLSYDSRGNSVPTILLLMQRHLYAQGGLQVEGIFRINPDNSQEEHVRDQLNLGLIPEGIDVHCLAGLIKAWFRELPTGVLDSLSQEQVMQCQTEEECVELARHLPHTEAALLDWAINLMADVAQHEHLNKMNARNIAMVFAPNMTQMADPFTALMYAVQVMNFLKLLILRTLRERKDSVVESYPRLYLEPYDENGHHTLLESSQQDTAAENEEAQDEENVVSEENSVLECSAESLQNNSSTEGESGSLISSSENPICNGDLYCEFPPKGFVLEKSVLECSAESLQNNSSTGGESGSLISSSENPVCKRDLYCEYPPKGNMGKSKSGQSSSSNARKGPKKKQHVIHTMPVEKKGTRTMSARDTRSERTEAAWR